VLQPAFTRTLEDGAELRVSAHEVRELVGRIAGRVDVLVQPDAELTPGEWQFSWKPDGPTRTLTVMDAVEAPPTLALVSASEVTEVVGCSAPRPVTFGPLVLRGDARAMEYGERALSAYVRVTFNGLKEPPPGFEFDLWLLPAEAPDPGSDDGPPPTLERTWNRAFPDVVTTRDVDGMPSVRGGEELKLAVRGVMPGGRVTNLVVATLVVQDRGEADGGPMPGCAAATGWSPLLLVFLVLRGRAASQRQTRLS